MTTWATVPAADTLKFAAAKLRQCIDWATDAISGAGCDADDGHENPIDALDDIAAHIQALTLQYGDPDRYSDGRRVTTSALIDNHMTTTHIWEPDPDSEEPQSWRSNLLHDPDTPDRGIYEVSTNPRTQEVHVCVVRNLVQGKDEP